MDTSEYSTSNPLGEEKLENEFTGINKEAMAKFEAYEKNKFNFGEAPPPEDNLEGYDKEEEE